VKELEDIIRSEIAESGAIPFARFMELALYQPGLGYYERGLKQTGRQGDFYTSVSVGSLYGELLGFDFARRLASLPGRASIIEAGAHDGQLAHDTLAYLRQHQPETFRRIEYVIVEPSRARAEQQFQTLAPLSSMVRWARGWSEIGEFRGICFSNELLDAMPVHVFRWDIRLRDWIEQGVGSRGAAFEWLPLPQARASIPARKLLARLPAGLQEVLPQDFTVEVSPAAVSWWLEAAHALEEGWLLTADYGFLQEEFLLPQRSGGTLRAYSRHRVSGHVLDAPGEQDLTAHVNFTLLMAAAESAGLLTEELTPQGIYLKTILERVEQDASRFPLWTAMRYRQLTSLVHPEHLGRAFKMLVQNRIK
jgi:SAM-dependent MidA family methyltransferase